MTLLYCIASQIADFENRYGKKPDYVMIHPERMAILWREFGEMEERGLIRRDKNAVEKVGHPVFISGVEVRESVFLPLRDSNKLEYAFWLGLDPR